MAKKIPGSNLAGSSTTDDTTGETIWNVASAGSGQQASAASQSVVPASDSAPFPVAGQYNSPSPTITSGQNSILQIGSRGALSVTLFGANSANSVSVGAPADGNANPSSVLWTASFNEVFDGTNWQRARGDTTSSFTKAPPLGGTDRSVTAGTTSAQLMAANALRGKFFVKNDSTIDVWINFGATAVAAAGSGNIKIAASGGYFEFSGSSGAVNIIAASAGAAVTAREF